MKGNYIALSAANDVIVDVDKEVARKSKLIGTLLENAEVDEGKPIPVEKYGEKVDARVLRMIFDWCEHHKNGDTSRRIDYVRTPFYALPPIDEWDQTFMTVDLDTLFEITVAAHFLDIPALQDLGCRTIASTITGKPPREIRAMFGNHDIPIGDDEQSENTTTSQLWNATRVFSPLVQLAKSMTGSSQPHHSSSATFPPLTPADLPASYTYRTTWLDFIFVRGLIYHFPLRSCHLFDTMLFLRIAALGCRPWVVARRSEKQSYCVVGDENSTTSGSSTSSSSSSSSVAGLYLSTEPLPGPDQDAQLWLPIPQRIVFQVRAVGQGWVRGDGGGERDVLDGRHAWFEASILASTGVPTDGETLQDVLAGDTWETPVQARGALKKQGWDFVEREDGGVVWKVCDGVTTSGRYQDCRVEWKRGVETQVEDGSGVGKGDGFLETLTSTSIVVLWARAEHKHRENRVGAAAIEIEYEFPPPFTTR